MFSLAYVSRAVERFDEPALDELADKAADKNARLGVTGYLHHRNGVFFQYLEGSEEVVLGLMQVIAADPRHEVLNVVPFGRALGRRFHDWGMRHVTPADVAAIRLEDVLERVLTTMSGPHFDPELSRQTALRLVDKIADERGRLVRSGR